MTADAKNKALRNFYEFDDADLEANRAGRLTEKQLKAVNTVLGTNKYLAYGFGGLLVGVGLLIGAILFCLVLPALLLATLLSGRLAFAEINASGWIGIAIGFIGMFICLAGGFFVYRFFSAKSSRSYILSKVGGAVEVSSQHISSEHGSGYEEYLMRFGNVEFVLDDELVGQVNSGERYNVYFVDYQDGSEGIIQSMEFLG